MSAVIEDQATVKKASSARFLGPSLRGIALIVALWAFIKSLPELFYDDRAGSGTALLLFVVATIVLKAMTPPSALAPTEGEGAETARQRRLPWPLFILLVSIGLGFNWVCAFLWFSRRYPVFSGQVIGGLVSIYAFFAVIGFAAAWLTGGNRRTALLVFVFGSSAVGAIVLRLHLLR